MVQAVNEYGGLSAKALVSVTDGISELTTRNMGNAITGIYSVDGKRLAKVVPGINIIRYADGETKKVIVK